MYDYIRNALDSVIKKNTPEAVLFSGGIDSASILYHAHQYKQDVMAITVGVQGKQTLDIEYSKAVAKQLAIKNHHVVLVTPEQVKNMVETSVQILQSFSPEWISSTTTLLLGMQYAKKEGLKSISSGEGADDLLGSFPFFTNWKGDYESLDTILKKRLEEIAIMSDLTAKSVEIEYIAPFQDEHMKNIILSIPIEERMKKEGKIKTKYPLRKAYETILPQICITRPQTMAFTGSGVYETIREIDSTISDEEFYQAYENILKFKSKFEYALFKIYCKHFKFKQQEKGGCLHCRSNMGTNQIHCKICATLQAHGKEVEFNGDE